MKRTLAFALLALAAANVGAQQKSRQEPADPAARTARPPYASAFEGYRPYTEPEVARWRELNEEAGRLGGHVGHVPQQPGTLSKPGAKPPAPTGHGAHR